MKPENKIYIDIPGKPVPKARARIFTRDGIGMSYDPQSEKKYDVRKQMIHEIQRQGYKFDPQSTFNVRMDFHVPMPSTFNQKQKNLASWNLIRPDTKPDGSNMLKFYEDAANGYLYPDDGKLNHIEVDRFYSFNPHTEIEVMEVKSPPIHSNVENVFGIFSKDEFEVLMNKMHAISTLYGHQKHGLHIGMAEALAEMMIDIADNNHAKLKKISQIKKKSL